jgi:5-methylcytosine-specific restriction protein A
MARPRMRVCSRPSCPNLHAGTGRCPSCEREADNARASGTKTYDPQHRTRFRPGVLRRDRTCQCAGCTAHEGQCLAAATVADHYPLSHAELVASGMDPYDPANGRGLCASCHNRWTAASTGGWSKATG